MKFEHIEVFNIEGAIHGMRNPLESWNKSDSYYGCHNGSDHQLDNTKCVNCIYSVECNELNKYFIIGENNLKLAQKLIKAGSDHSKFMRQIFVSVDIAAPLYWWKEFDTYKVGTVANSTSTMHKLATTPITMECFEIDDLSEHLVWSCVNGLPWSIESTMKTYVNALEDLRLKYIETKDIRCWKELIRWLPESWLQTRTVTMSYQNLRQMYFARRNHKLTEWADKFCNEFIKSLPYSEELICYE